MDRKAIKKSFRNLLPHGFTKTIQKRLHEKNINKSQSLISKVCDFEKENWNADIIAEALILAKEESQKNNAISKTADSL